MRSQLEVRRDAYPDNCLYKPITDSRSNRACTLELGFAASTRAQQGTLRFETALGRGLKLPDSCSVLVDVLSTSRAVSMRYFAVIVDSVDSADIKDHVKTVALEARG